MPCIHPDHYPTHPNQQTVDIFVKSSNTKTCPSLGVLITDTEDYSVELYSPPLQCALSHIPPPEQLHLTQSVFCSVSCFKFSAGVWSVVSLPWERRVHVVWRVEEGFILMGGRLSTGYTDTTVMLRHNGTFQSTFQISSRLGSERISEDGLVTCVCRGACGIEEDDSIVLLGGFSGSRNYLSQVTRYSLQGHQESLPALGQARFGAGCAKYEEDGGVVYLVTGGGSNGQTLASTEILSPGSGSWKEVASLPQALQGLVGVTLDNTVLMTGDQTTDHLLTILTDCIQEDSTDNMTT